MKTNTRKSFWLVDCCGKALSAHQDTEFNGIDNVLVFARSDTEALVIAEAYANDAIGVDNVVADDGEVVAAASAQSEDVLSKWIEIYGKKLITEPVPTDTCNKA